MHKPKKRTGRKTLLNDDENDFVNSISMDDETLIDGFQLVYKGKVLSNDEAKSAIAFLRNEVLQGNEIRLVVDNSINKSKEASQ